MKPAEIRDKMEKLALYIQDAETSVRDGKIVNLKGLDKDVALICTKATSLSPPDARDLQPVMAELIGNLERLASALKDFQNRSKT